MDSRDGVAKDRVEGGEEEGVGGSVHDEQAGAKEQDLKYIICSIIFGTEQGYLPKWAGHRRYNIGECICIFIEKTFRKFQREDALACGNNWKEMVVDAIGKSNV